MWIREKNEDTLIALRVYPNAKKEIIDGIRDDHLVVRLNAPPNEGKANKALFRFISKRLRVPKTRISLIRGEKNRIKVIRIEGMSPVEVREHLDPTQ
ncbi:MAG: DUF167 domain-containing protein [Thermodesulfobacteriota bacterium]|nr:DUF167 domain-containing protein [Thermodesulfobacteriota bacterium]